jgi:beta-glucosidase
MNVDETLARMTLEDKATLTVGSGFWTTAALPRLGVRGICLSDGPHGLRKQGAQTDNLGVRLSEPATCFPSASAQACTFDPDLIRAMGAALGEECRAEHVDLLLGPGINIKRHPLCGRNFEYYSEDPLLSGALGCAFIEGVQSRGVGACPKHFAANNQEKARMISDSLVDERALNEVYLRPFERCVKRAHPWAIMGAYNSLNGEYCTENAPLLTDKLRREWGFSGCVVTDWGALVDSARSVDAGLDLAMPGPQGDHVRAVVRAVGDGELSEGAVERAARCVLTLQKRADDAQNEPVNCDFKEHARLARRIARESAVLLKNDGILPLAPGTRCAVVGAFAKHPRYQGSGSSKINPTTLDCAFDALTAAGARTLYAPGYDLATGETTPHLLDQARLAAQASEVALVFVGLPDRFESEGFDRQSFDMPKGHVKLIEEVCAANPSTVVVLSCGAPVDTSWSALPAAILLNYLGGCQSGGAVADLVMGRANPQGKLAETWPARIEDTALGTAYPDQNIKIAYRESIYVGYRYYDAAHVEPAYPFGFGLSYTTFSIENAHVEPDAARGCFVASCDVANTGDCAGAEVVQLYATAPDATVFRPAQWLVAFKKVRLDAGACTHVEIELGADAFSYWDESAHGWRVDAGAYTVCFSASSRDVRAEVPVSIGLGDAPFSQPVSVPAVVDSARRRALAPYYQVTPHGFTDEGFEAVFGRPVPEVPPATAFSMHSTPQQMMTTRTGRAVVRIIETVANRSIPADDVNTRTMLTGMMRDMPLRAVQMGAVPRYLVDAAVAFLNGKVVRGLRILANK